MFEQFSKEMREVYTSSRSILVAAPERLIACEKFVHHAIMGTLTEHLEEFREDYNEASYLFPFWKNYPPEDRGRSPVGDQFPWIEVGEHSIGCKLARFLSSKFDIREVGLPSGPDQRFLLRSPAIRKVLGFTDAAMVLIDVKSVGPRDDFAHTVLSPYQVSGNGEWKSPAAGVRNGVLQAIGKRTNHNFHCALPPLYVFSTLCAAPSISIFVKPIYSMIPAVTQNKSSGQPLERITVATLPNGLLLTENPNYLKIYPGLFFPGKDDKTKSAERRRARVSFDILSGIDSWRVQTLDVSSHS
jgi:hypothetical protein